MNGVEIALLAKEQTTTAMLPFLGVMVAVILIVGGVCESGLDQLNPASPWL